MTTGALLLAGVSGSALAGFAPDAGVYLDARGDEVRPIFKEGLAHDLASIDACFDLTENTLVVDVRFFNEIGVGRGSSGANPDLVMFLGIDVDGDASTGDKPLQNSIDDLFTPLHLGVDVEIALVPFGPEGHVEVSTYGEGFLAPVEFFSRRMVATIDLDELSGLGVSPGVLGFAAIFGTEAQPTDATDSIGYTRVVVPTPGAAGLLALSGLVGVSRRRR
jgi:hypothetical protein